MGTFIAFYSKRYNIKKKFIGDFILNLLTNLYFNYARPKFDVNSNYNVGNMEESEIVHIVILFVNKSIKQTVGAKTTNTLITFCFTFMYTVHL